MMQCGTLPVKEGTVDDSGPSEARRFLGLEILGNGGLVSEHRNQLQDPGIGSVAAKFGGNEAFDTRFRGSVGDGVVLLDRNGGQKVDDGILALEDGD